MTDETEFDGYVTKYALTKAREATAWKTDAGKLVGYRTTRGDGAGIEVARDSAFIISRFGNNDNGRWNEAGALEAATFYAKQLNVGRI